MATQPHLFMRRPRLDDLPALLPPRCGYDLRLVRPDEDVALADLFTSAFNTWTIESVRQQLTRAPDVQAVYVIAHANQLVATASARLLPDRFPDSGYLHWLAVRPTHRNQGFARLVCLRVLHHFRDQGRRDAVLETDEHRFAAIQLYLSLGFRPEHRR